MQHGNRKIAFTNTGQQYLLNLHGIPLLKVILKIMIESTTLRSYNLCQSKSGKALVGWLAW
jgi:hypothetical protein